MSEQSIGLRMTQQTSKMVSLCCRNDKEPRQAKERVIVEDILATNHNQCQLTIADIFHLRLCNFVITTNFFKGILKIGISSFEIFFSLASCLVMF